MVAVGTVSIGFVEENGGRGVGANITAGQSYVIPRGETPDAPQTYLNGVLGRLMMHGGLL